MGRRNGFLTTMLREMEKANRRAVAEAQRNQRQARAALHRALERQLIREERAMEHARKREEREYERRALAEARTHASMTKQAEKAAAKDAQLRAWQLEFDASDERERDLDRIGNDSPEVEDRDQMYSELAVRRAFEAEPFLPPAPLQSHAQARAIQMNAAAEMNDVLVGFRPIVGNVRIVQAVAAALTALGILLAIAVAAGAGAVLLVVGALTLVVAQIVASNSIDRQRLERAASMRQQIEARTRNDLAGLEQSDRQRTEQAVAQARDEYGRSVQRDRAEFEEQETARIAALAELHQGNALRIKEVIETALDLELPVECRSAFTVHGPDFLSIELDLPHQDVLPREEAKLLASGKVSYKAKSEKRLRDQYQRLVAGIALRYASETMLNVPTCTRVEIRAMVTDLDPSEGRMTRRCLLDVTYDYATLAPMTMDAIDPIAALKRFPHQLSIDRKNNDIGRIAAN